MLKCNQEKQMFPRQASFLEPSVNPFIHRINLSFSQKLHVVLMSVTIAPLRLLLSFLFLVLTWFVGLFVTWSIKVGDNTPLSGFHLASVQSLRWLGRVVLFFHGFHHITVKGKRVPSSEAPLLVAAPHSTVFDAIVYFVCDPIPSTVSRLENSSVPFIGRLMTALQPIYVSRADPNSRRSTIDQIRKRACSGGKWPQVLLFPEGTCTNRKALISFKTGAFIPGVPVQPVAIRYPNAVDTLSWTMNGPGALTVFWLTLCQFQTKCEVHYLPVYIPTDAEKQDPKLYANNVRDVIADVLNVPCTGYTFEDCRLMRHAAKLNLPMETGLVEFTKISRKLGMDIDGIQNHLSEFASIAQEHKGGLISIEDFARFLQMPITPALQEMFSLYDRNSCGKIDFREYVIGLSLVSQPAVTDDTVQLAFKIFDKNGDGMISKDEFCHVLQATFGDEFNGDIIFNEMQKRGKEKVSYDEFFSFVKQRPEYAKVFLWYKEMRRDDLKKVLGMPKPATTLETLSEEPQDTFPNGSEDLLTTASNSNNVNLSNSSTVTHRNIASRHQEMSAILEESQSDLEINNDRKGTSKNV